MANVPFVTFNNGQKFPSFGLGTYNSDRGQVEQAVKDAIDAGYRHIDGAFIYQNEEELGAGVNAKIAEGVIKREDIYLTSKLWSTFHRPDLVRGAIEASLKALNTPYIDLYLIHWPQAFLEDRELMPVDEDGEFLPSLTEFTETWAELEKAVDDGLLKSIGVSNFNRAQLERLLAVARILPVTNQVECHPYLQQKKLAAFMSTKGIVLTAYSPLAAPDRAWAGADDPVLLKEPIVQALAAKYGKEAGHIALRYQIQRGHIVIPKSVKQSRIVSNIDVFDFELTAEDLAQLESLERNFRVSPKLSTKLRNYPFNDEY